MLERDDCRPELAFTQGTVFHRADKTLLLRDQIEHLVKETRRVAVLSSVINLFYVKRLPNYFYHWKAKAIKSKELMSAIYPVFLKKTFKLRGIIEKKLSSLKDSARKRLMFWRLYTMHFPPHYDDKVFRGKAALRRILTNQNQLVLSENKDMRAIIASKKRRASVHRDSLGDEPNVRASKEKLILMPSKKPGDMLAVCQQVDYSLGELLETRFSSLKRNAFDMFKILQGFENRVINSEQPLLLRTLRLSHERYLNKYKDSSSVHLKPRTLLQIVKDKDKHFDPEYDLRPGFEGKYLNKFMHKKRLVGLKNSTSNILLTGVWSEQTPYLRFKDYFMMKVIQNNYLANLITTFQVLRSYNTRIERKKEVQQQMHHENRKFKATWGSIYLKIMFIDRAYILSLDMMSLLEVNRRRLGMENDLEQQKAFLERGLQLRAVREKSEIVPLNSQQFKVLLARRLSKLLSNFANGFLNVIFDPTLEHRDKKQKLCQYVYESLHYLIAESLQAEALSEMSNMMRERMRRTDSPESFAD